MAGYTFDSLPVTAADDGVEVRTERTGDHTIGWARLPAGLDLRPALTGLPDDRCPCPHWGYMLKGSFLLEAPDGEHVYRAGEAFYWPPGHTGRVLEDCEWVEISPTDAFEEVMAHMGAQTG